MAKCSKMKHLNTVMNKNNLIPKLSFLMMTNKEKDMNKCIREKEFKNHKLF
jgi:hypothetical protein